MKDRPTYEEWLETVPEEKRDTTNYNLRRAYELAPQKELDAFAKSDAHLYSAYYNPETDEYEFMKSKDHPSLQSELDWYYSDKPDAVEFRKEFYLDKSGDYYKYKRKGGFLDEILNRRKAATYGN